ncbi:MAG: hypothetical protein WAT19_02145 [Ferruginibacter sp.]
MKSPADTSMLDLREKIISGLDLVKDKLIEEKKKNGGLLIVSRNGKIVKIKPQ